ncbi:MAG: flagellar basal body P-ring protein FlgI [Phycisphaerae bacterium]
MLHRIKPLGLALLWLVGVALVGCKEGWREELAARFNPEKQKVASEQSESTPSSPPVDAAIADTLAAVSSLTDARPLRLRGFGLVVGLGDQGSTDCPSAIREYLIEFLNKNLDPQARRESDERAFSASQLVDAPDSAVVEVSGELPPGAPRGAIFDLRIDAVAGTNSRSLEGGLLLPCELRVYRADATGSAMLSGRVMARGGGPVFVNPFASASDATSVADPRRGWVLGGAFSSEERTTRLVLRDPSYAAARRVEQRVNERFGQAPRTADALSRGFVTLHTPPAYAARPDRFLELVTAICLESQPGYIERKLREMTELLVTATERRDRIALVCEAIGRTAIPQLQALYSHADALVSYYAARTGLRLRDATALPVMAQIAAARAHPMRIAAVRELGAASAPQIAQRLMPLLDDPDQDVRIAAYEGLLAQRSSAIQSRRLPHAIDADQVNLILDTVESRAAPFVYVRRSREPRLAVFGAKTPVATPIFYTHDGHDVMINAADRNADVTVYARERYGRPIGQPVIIPARLAELIAALADHPRKSRAGRIPGIGLAYSQVVQVLDALHRENLILAPLVLEQVSLTELLGPEPRGERPEGDETTSEPDDHDEREDAARDAERPNDAPLLPREPERPEGDPEGF